MYNVISILLGIALIANSVEISSSYSLLEKQIPFHPNIKTEPVDKGTVKRDASEPEQRPVYNPEDYKAKRANIEPVKPNGPVVKDDRMLADQPVDGSTEANRVEAIPGYAYVPSLQEVSYPDVPYAPAYGYDNSNYASHRYDMYGNSPSTYYVEPDTSPFSFLWSQVPDARTIVSYVGGIVSWTLGNLFLIFLGSLLTVGVCSYTNICAITYSGVGPIHEEMRSLMTPERLDKISTAAGLVKTAIDKYQEQQHVAEVAVKRRRRATLF